MSDARRVSRRLKFMRILCRKKTPVLKAGRLILDMDSIPAERRVQTLTETQRLTLVSHGSNQYQLALSQGTDFPQIEQDGTLKDFDHRNGWIANSVFFSFFEPNLIGLIPHRNGPSHLQMCRFFARQMDIEFRQDFGTLRFVKLADIHRVEQILEDIEEFHRFEISVENAEQQLSLADEVPLDGQMGRLMSESEPDRLYVGLLGRHGNRAFDGWTRRFLEAWIAGAKLARPIKRMKVGGTSSATGEEVDFNLLKRYCEFPRSLPTKSGNSGVLDPVAAFSELEATFREHKEHILRCKLSMVNRGKKRDGPSLFE